jgi:methanogenic corrinoid protein MtbC1
VDQLRSDYWAALEAGDRCGALDVVKDEQSRGRSATAIIDALVVPAQARIGELWLAGAWSAEQERAATAINEGLVHWLGSFAPEPDPGRPTVVVACVEDERNSLPALVVAEGLAWSGYRVVQLGGDPDHLVREVLVVRPRAVLFHASLTSSLAPLRRIFVELRAMGIPVVAGGNAFGGDPARAAALGATAYAADLADATRILDALPERLEQLELPPRTPCDVEAEWILEQRQLLTEGVVRRLLGRTGRAAVPPAWWPDLVSHVDHVVGCVAAAVATGDRTIVADAHDWLGDLVAARGGDRGVVDELWALLVVPLSGHPIACAQLTVGATHGGPTGLAPSDEAAVRAGA